MDVNAPSSAAQSQQSSGSGLNGGSKLAEDFDTFLGILTTQLKNQDPLEPMKSQEFTNQLVQFSTVEQAIATNSKLDKMLAAQADNRATQAVNFIGKDVGLEGNQVQLKDGAAQFAYKLDGDAQAALVSITNQSGDVVRSISGPTGAGRHDVTWDGTGDGGKALPDGVYNIQVRAVDGQDQTVQATTEVRGEVTEMRDDKISLQLGDREVPFENVTSVYDQSQSGADESA